MLLICLSIRIKSCTKEEEEIIISVTLIDGEFVLLITFSKLSIHNCTVGNKDNCFLYDTSIWHKHYQNKLHWFFYQNCWIITTMTMMITVPWFERNATTKGVSLFALTVSWLHYRNYYLNNNNDNNKKCINCILILLSELSKRNNYYGGYETITTILITTTHCNNDGMNIIIKNHSNRKDTNNTTINSSIR